MKRSIKIWKTPGLPRLCIVLFLIALWLAQPSAMAAQTYSVLNVFSYSQGEEPKGGLVLANGALFGTTSAGGAEQGGEIFTVNPDGSGFSIIKSLGNTNGAQPFGTLLQCGGRLYGTATMGGAYSDPYAAPEGYGAVFGVDLTGSNFVVLHNFDGTNGGAPYAGLIESGGMLYGTTFDSGTNGFGTLFKLSTNGTGFTVLKAFSPLVDNTNWDGARPYGGLVECGGTLYGTATYGGTNGAGTVFQIGTNGGGYKVLKTFSALANYVNSDGAYPSASLLCDHGTLYGTTYAGGGAGNGTVFSLNEDGSAFATLKVFSMMGDYNVNSDGAHPYSTLILSGNTLYGTAYDGGTNGFGTLFKVNTIATGFSVLTHFGTNYGSNPYSGLLMSENTLFGTAASGPGTNGGTVFSLALPSFAAPAPALKIQTTSSTTLLLVWDCVPGYNYQVQFTTNLAEFNQWTNFRGLLSTNGSTLSTPDFIVNKGRRCYRVVVVP